ncbi:MAG: SRPBCC family protein [Burkholderiaceae bacterium]
MNPPATATAIAERERVFERILDATPAQLCRCWTEPELLTQWFAPRPWTTPSAEMEVRPGGASRIVMRGPDGQEFPNRGVYLEVVPNRRLVFTDAYVSAWKPSNKPFMTGTFTLDDLGDGRTRYTARVTHWSAEDRQAHEAMGFRTGWGICTEQLAALAKTL